MWPRRKSSFFLRSSTADAKCAGRHSSAYGSRSNTDSVKS